MKTGEDTEVYAHTHRHTHTLISVWEGGPEGAIGPSWPPFFGQFRLKIRADGRKFRTIPTQNRSPYINFFGEMTEKKTKNIKTARIFIKRKCPKFGQFTNFRAIHTQNS